MLKQRHSLSLLADYPILLTIDESADILHVKRRSISRYVAQGLLVATKLKRGSGTAGRRLILRSSVEALIAAGMDNAGERP